MYMLCRAQRKMKTGSSKNDRSGTELSTGKGVVRGKLSDSIGRELYPFQGRSKECALNWL